MAILPKARKRKRAQRTAAAARDRLDGVRAEIRELGSVGHPIIAREREGVSSALVENRRQLGRANAGPEPAVAPFDLDRWVLWQPDRSVPMTELRVGSLRESGEGELLGVPCVVPIQPGRSILIVSRTDRQRDAARALWQGLVTRLAALAAGREEVVLLDPAGTSFPQGHRLFTKVVTAVDIPIELDRWRRGLTDARTGWVVACDVPAGMSHRDAALLLAMVRSAALGTRMIVHVDEDAYRSAAGEPDLGDDSTRWLLETGDAGLVEDDLGMTVVWDDAPSQALIDLIADRLAAE